MKLLITVVCFNEFKTIEGVLRSAHRVVQRLAAEQPQHKFAVLIVDDHSSDGSEELIVRLGAELGFATVRNPSNRGVGYSIWQGFQQANREQSDAIAIMAGNGKMDPEQIPAVVQPILDGRADFVQGSRYVQGGGFKMPLFRIVGTQLFTVLVNLFMRSKLTDTTCGFRAYTMALVRDSRLNVNQEWLFKYEMEFYLLFYAMKLRYRITEVAVTMNYPHKRKYSKIKPLTGWWSMIKPWVMLYSGVRR